MSDTVLLSTNADPLRFFHETFTRVAQGAPADHSAAALATVGADGRPSVRMVLLRRYDERGFIFFTNYGSRKASQLDATGVAALCFHWHWLEEQVRIEGRVTRATEAESDEYWATRPRGSQAASWSSRQSQALETRATLESRYLEVEREYDGRPIPRPPFWGGYRLTPERIEFWKGATYRLHDRVVYTRQGDHWVGERQYP
ncbi:MAG: pyridoxamine 5'-phosphate oxidase [Vicinamibacterales bacterium]